MQISVSFWTTSLKFMVIKMSGNKLVTCDNKHPYRMNTLHEKAHVGAECYGYRFSFPHVMPVKYCKLVLLHPCFCALL